MDQSRLLILGGAGLVGASVLALGAVLLLGGEDEPTPLPDAVDAAPRAPSQSPDPAPRAPRPPSVPDAGGEPPAAADGPVRDPVADELTGSEGEAAPQVPRRPPPSRRPAAGRATTPPVTFCFPGVIPTPDGCATRETIIAFAGEPIGIEGPGGVEPLTVKLADPDDLSAQEREVGTCDDYLALKRRGWGALTSADLSRDLRMNRFCGLIAMARRAEPATRGGLTRLTYGGLERVPNEDWPRIGEAQLTDPSITADADDDRLWRIEGETLTLTLRDVGAADLDGDGVSEVLVHTGLAARGGTARGGGYLIAEGERGGTVRLRPADLYTGAGD